MNQVEDYKGFVIATENGRFIVLSRSADDMFKPEGYATLNNAKGAITKHLNHTPPFDEKHALPSLESNSNTQGSATEYLLASPANAAHLEASLAQVRAGQVTKRELVEVHLSRNQREGGYGGKTWTTPTGKARHFRGGKGTTRFTLKAWAKLMRSSDAGE